MSNLGLALSHLPITPDGFPRRRPGHLPRSRKAVRCMLMNGGVPVRRRNASEARAGSCRERVPRGPPSRLAGCQLDAVYISPAVGPTLLIVWTRYAPPPDSRRTRQSRRGWGPRFFSSSTIGCGKNTSVVIIIIMITINCLSS